MYLKSIELTGFKSFAKKVELQFNTAISAIVGPNGSGKSNIAEAFRFVLGEQSIKSLRGKRGEDLIWNGTGESPRANRASVKVIFDNSFKFLPIDYETVTIERVVHRDSVNEYLINNSQVRLRDVVELLANASIGSSGHHIISQGEADRILNASIKERKGMIEDALGLRLYQYKKQESERKLEKTRENIEKVESLRREIAPHIRFLKRQVEKVEKALEMKNELQVKAVEYLSRENNYINKIEIELSKEKTPLEKKQNELNGELEKVKSVLEKSKSGDERSLELINLEKNLNEIRNEKDKLIGEFGRLDGELNSLVRMVKKQEEIASLHEHKTVKLSSVEEISLQIESKVREVKSTSDVEKLLKTLDEVSRILFDFIDSNKDKIDHSLLVDVNRDIENLKNTKKQIERSLNEIKQKEAEYSEKYNLVKSSIEKEKDSNRDAEKKIFQIMSEISETHSKLQVVKVEEEKLKLVREDFKRELTELSLIIGAHVLDFHKLSLNYDEPRSVQEERRKVMEKIKIRLEDSGVSASNEVIREHQEASERDAFLEKELIDLEKSAASLKELIADLNERLSTEFKIGISKINAKFQEFFALMFGGGEAKLSLVTPPKKKISSPMSDIGEEIEEIQEEFDLEARLPSNYTGEEIAENGIEIQVSLPKKKVKGLMMLSGGERALTSIALLFAVSQVNPPPFIILDETDAALDEANSKKYGDMIEDLSKYSQLIVITHNRETMSRAGVLYGVTMGSSGGSKLLSIAFDEAVAVAK